MPTLYAYLTVNQLITRVSLFSSTGPKGNHKTDIAIATRNGQFLENFVPGGKAQ